MRARFSAIIWVASFYLLLSGCDYIPFGYTNIGEITKNPTAFEGKNMKMRGIASPVVKIPFTELKGYRLKDETGEIVVISQGQMPGDGDEIVVHGRIENLVIVAGQSMGLIFKEERRTSVSLN